MNQIVRYQDTKDFRYPAIGIQICGISGESLVASTSNRYEKIVPVNDITGIPIQEEHLNTRLWWSWSLSAAPSWCPSSPPTSSAARATTSSRSLPSTSASRRRSGKSSPSSIRTAAYPPTWASTTSSRSSLFSGLRIRLDLHSFSLLDPYPDPGGKNC